MVKLKRPIVQPVPAPGDLYTWEGGDGSRQFIIVNVDAKHREIWMSSALEIGSGTEIKIGIRKRDANNGWTKIG
jgi:hypothetical protein